MTEISELTTRLRELLAKATPGEWEHRRGYVLLTFEAGEEIVIADVAGGDAHFDWGTSMKENGDLIAESHNVPPRLLDHIESLEKANRLTQEFLNGLSTADVLPMGVREIQEHGYQLDKEIQQILGSQS